MKKLLLILILGLIISGPAAFGVTSAYAGIGQGDQGQDENPGDQGDNNRGGNNQGQQ
jgi:hypothetical protein